jgi:hypothetical protein
MACNPVDIGEEETTDPNYADDRTFFKVEKWTKNNLRVAEIIYAGNLG